MTGTLTKMINFLYTGPLSTSISALILYISVFTTCPSPKLTGIPQVIQMTMLTFPPKLHHLCTYIPRCPDLPASVLPNTASSWPLPQDRKSEKAIRETSDYHRTFLAPILEPCKGDDPKVKVILKCDYPRMNLCSFHGVKWGLPCSSPYCMEGRRDVGWGTDSHPDPVPLIHSETPTRCTFKTINLSCQHPNRAHGSHPGTNSL